MAPDRSGEDWRDAALLLDIVLAAKDASGFVAHPEIPDTGDDE